MIWDTKKERPLAEHIRLADIERTRATLAAGRARPVRWKDIRKAIQTADAHAVAAWAAQYKGTACSS